MNNLSQVGVSDAVNVATGDVRVNGEVVPDTDKTNHVMVIPKSSGATTGRAIVFKQLSKVSPQKSSLLDSCLDGIYIFLPLD